MDVLFASLVALFSCVLLFAEWRGMRPLKFVAKPLAASSFVACAVARGAAETPYGQALLVALVFSWFGDVFLLSRATKVFLAGLVAFLLGHLAYAGAFLVQGVAWPWVAAGAVLCGGVFVPVRGWLLPHVEPKMKGPVLAYMAVISLMLAGAVGVAATGRPLTLLAALMFYVSDLAVARDRFVAPGFANKTWGLPLYFGAQVAFCWTL